MELGVSLFPRCTIRVLVFALLTLLIPSLAIAQTDEHATAKASGKTNLEKALTQMEDDWGKAFVNKDTAALDKILADDWVGQYPYGNKSKQQLFEDLRSGTLKVEDVSSGPMKVRVFGNSAIVTGSDDGKVSYKGRDYSGHEVWTDVFVKRKGQWRAVASQNGVAEKP